MPRLPGMQGVWGSGRREVSPLSSPGFMPDLFCLAQMPEPVRLKGPCPMSTQSLFSEDPRIELHITLDWSKERITFDWRPYQTDKKLAHGAVWVANGLLRWRITGEGEADNFDCLVEPTAIEMAIHHV